MTEIPVAVKCDEVIVRGICHPFHLNNKGKLKWNAFRPPPERRDVSVIRKCYMGVEFCKRKAQELTDPLKNKSYCGLAFLRAEAAREVDADVVDSRDLYLGHADIIHACSAPARGEPPPPEKLEVLREACKHLVNSARFVIDSNPESTEWNLPETPPNKEVPEDKSDG
jgi:hypothetical protein